MSEREKPKTETVLDEKARLLLLEKLFMYGVFETQAIMRGHSLRDLMNEFDDLKLGRELSDPFDVFMRCKESEWIRRDDPIVMSEEEAQKLRAQVTEGTLVEDFLKAKKKPKGQD